MGEAEKKKMGYKATHRGTKELDILLAKGLKPFLDNPSLTADQIEVLQMLLELSDPVLMDWLLHDKPLPNAFKNDKICKIFRNQALEV